jgi:hypothetical protein
MVEQSTEGGGGARPPVGRTLNLAYGVPNSNSTLPTRSRRQGDSDFLTYMAENGPRVAGDDGVARLMSGDGEGTLWWSSGSRNGFSSSGCQKYQNILLVATNT